MSFIETLPFVQALGWTLLHFLWQGAIVALWFTVLNAALKNRTANSRYLASCAAMLLMLALPLITFVALSANSVERTARTADLLARPEAAKIESLKSALRRDSLITGASSETSQPASQTWNLGMMFSQFAPWFTSLWLVGVVVLSLRMLGGWLYARRLKNYRTSPLSEQWQQRFAGLCCEIRILRPVRILESALAQVPTVIGWMRPVILVPASALMGLTPRQLEAVIAHELAHIRRYDYLVNLLQTAVEILLFYHPAVWWVSQRMRQEREHCCDDVAVEVCGDALTYARALTEIEALRSITPRLATAADGGSLIARIQRIVGKSPQRSEQSGWVAGVVVFAIVFLLAAGAQFFSASTQANESIAQGESPPPIATSDTARTESLSAQVPEGKSIAREVAEREPIEESEASTDKRSGAEPQQSPSSGSGFIEELFALGYTNLSVDEIIELKNHGVTPQLVRELKAQGYDKLSIKQLMRLSSVGISVQVIKELKTAGLEQLPLESLIRLQTHGVSSALIKELGDLGYKNLSADQLARAASHGVTPEFIRALQSAGYKDLPIDEVVRSHDHGVSAEFIKATRDQRYDQLALAQIMRMKDHGVDPEFMRAMNSAGFGRLPVEQLIRSRDHGVGPEFIEKIRSAGYSSATLDQLIRMKDHGVTPDYIESVRKAGYDSVPLDQLIRLRDHGVDAEFVLRVKSHGFQNLSIDQLIRLRDASAFN